MRFAMVVTFDEVTRGPISNIDATVLASGAVGFSLVVCVRCDIVEGLATSLPICFLVEVADNELCFGLLVA